MRIRNFTPHELNIYDARSDYSMMKFQSEGLVRATEEVQEAGQYGLDGCVTAEEHVHQAMQGMPCILAQFVTLQHSGVQGLPPVGDGPDDLKPGDVLVVSLVAAQALASAIHDVDPVTSEHRTTLRPWGGTELSALTEAGILVATPDTGPTGAVRDEGGRLIGTRRLVLADVDGGPELAKRFDANRTQEIAEYDARRHAERAAKRGGAA